MFAAALAAFLLGAGVPAAVVAQAAEEPDRENASSDDGAGDAELSASDREIEALVGPTSEELIVVTASRTAESLLDAPVAVTVVDDEAISTNASSNAVDLLRSVPGLNVMQTSARDFNITPRAATGVFSQGQLALVDGRPINEPNNGLVLWDQIPIFFDELERIEVQRGPGSAVWGANALHGVINLRTKSPRDLAGGLVEVTGGELDTKEARFRWAEGRDRFAYKLSLGWSDQDGWPRPDTLPGGEPIPAGFDITPRGSEQGRLDLRVDWDADERRTWSWRLGWAESTGLLVTRLVPLEFNDGTYSAYTEVTRRAENFDLRFSWNRVNTDSTDLLDGSQSISRTDSFLADATWTRRAGERHRFVYGASISPVQFDSDVIFESSRLDLGAFFEDQWTLSNTVLLHLGARVDHFDTFGLAVSPRVSLVVRPRPDHSLRFGWGRAYRSPTALENFLEFESLNAVDLGLPDLYVYPTIVVGDPDLDEVVNDTYEIGWTSVVGGHVVSAAAYRSVARDNIQFYTAEIYTPDDPPPGWPLDPELLAGIPLPKSFSYRNVARVESHGFELSVQSNWRAGLQTTFAYAWQDEPKVSDQTEGQPFIVNAPPKHQASARVSLVRPSFRFGFGLSWVDSAFFADVLDPRFWGETDSALLADVSATWSWQDERWGLTVGATNAFDDETQQHPYGDVIGRRATATFRARF